uniref:Uncharacterized protein n=1 Tax=Pyxicephalus adspersus TaxID=30357 RepID=A0AAV2ZLG0_PYXAD|nr:TPA: hypothetical protein GDO54_014749 [Pyxicephalus adspersus]
MGNSLVLPASSSPLGLKSDDQRNPISRPAAGHMMHVAGIQQSHKTSPWPERHKEEERRGGPPPSVLPSPMASWRQGVIKGAPPPSG